MSSDASSSTPEARELSLISKVELRIALADSDEKLQALLNTYLPPLLLKLGSESLEVRNKVIAVCQHVNTRVKSPSIKLPVTALLNQFKEQKSHLIRHFDLAYIQQGIDRLGSEAKIETLYPLLRGISGAETSHSHGAVIFNLILRLLPLLSLPAKGSEDDYRLRDRLGLSGRDTEFLSSWFEKLLVLAPATDFSLTCPGLSPEEYSFLNKEASIKDTWNPSAEGGLNLTETKATCLRLLSSGAFTDSERLLPAIIASSDTNSRIVDLGEEMLKRFTPNLEDDNVVQRLYSLYFGREEDGAPASRPGLQVKALAFLGKSTRATADTAKISRLIEDGLLSDTARSSQGLQASKLRTQIFTFITWVVRMGSPADLEQMLPKIIQGLRDFIESQGWPTPGASGKKLPATDISLRSLAYESIGIMMPKVDFQTQGEHSQHLGPGLAQWLFLSLSSDDSGPQISVSIEQALGGVLNSSLNLMDYEFKDQLRTFLIFQMDNQVGGDDLVSKFKVVRSSKYAVVRFANRFFPYHDPIARWIDLMAVAHGSQSRQEVVDEGKKGLHPYWYRLLNPRKMGQSPDVSSNDRADESWYNFPRFIEMSRYLLGYPDRGESTGLHGPMRLSGPYRDAFPHGVAFLRNILLWESFSKAGITVEVEHDWDYRLGILLSSDEGARLALKRYMQVTDMEDAVLTFLGSALDDVVSGSHEDLEQSESHFVEICSLASNGVVRVLLPGALALKGPLFSNDRDRQNTAARSIGMLISHPEISNGDLEGFVTELSDRIMTWKEAIGESVLKVRGATLGIAYLFSRLGFRGLVSKVPESRVHQFVNAVSDMLENARDSLLRQTAQMAVGQLSLAGILQPTFLPDSRRKSVRESLVRDAKAENEAPIIAMGLLSLTFSKDPTGATQFEEILDALYGLHEIRSPEVHFTVGDALSNAAVGWASKSLMRDFDVDAEVPSSGISSGVLATMCDKVIADSKASKPSLRKASAIWLLCLVKNCGHMQIMQERLRKCQATFAGLLGDRDEIVQESGAQGLSLVYEMGDQGLKYDLVQDLVDSFTSNKSGLSGGKVNTNTELFEPGALPTGEGSSVNTYKDIMNLASEAGDPTLVYRFMSLASNNAIWTNRAAFSRLGISNIFSDSNVTGYLAKNPKIYQKLYRYCFDPNTNVQRSMNSIWHTLVKDPVTVVNAHFDEIMEDLLGSMLTGREWRSRQASCAAVSNLIQTHQSDKYVGYINEIFNKAFKLLDDIKESVRGAALGLCQTITNSVIRTLETTDSKSNRAKSMLEHTIPFLLSDKGLESSVEEVQGFAIGALVQIIKKSPSWLIRPFTPRMLEEFLNSLSSLEPQAVNYVHLNADKYGLTGQDIDKMRLSSIRTSPMMEVTERFLIDNLDDASMKEFAPKLEGVLRSAVGLPTKVGCSRVLVLLSMRTVLFQAYADRFIQLLRKFVVDRNDTVSASYCTSIGYLSRLGPDDQVLKTIEYAIDLYTSAEDAPHRVIAAEILHSMSKLSNDRFMMFAATALPFVFVSKNDVDEHVRDVFEGTWQENVGGSRAVSLYIREIVAIVSKNLDSPRWSIKHTAAHAIASAVRSLDAELDLAMSELVWPVLEKALAGKTWEGKEDVVKALVRFAGQAKVLWKKKRETGDSMKVIAVREAKRNNPSYRPHALRALGGVSQARDDVDFMPDALSIVSGVVDHVLDAKGDEMDIDSGNGHIKSGEDETLSACMKCLLQCFGPKESASAKVLGEYLKQMASIIGAALGHGGRSVQMTLYEETQAFFTRTKQWIPQEDGGAQKPELGHLEEPLTALARELFRRPVDTSVEAIRRDRAQAAVAYISLRRQAGLKMHGELGETIKSWREGERSTVVQQTLEEALKQAQ